MAKLASVQVKWESVQEVEVPDDWQEGDDLPDNVINQLDSSNCYLVDWWAVRG